MERITAAINTSAPEGIATARKGGHPSAAGSPEDTVSLAGKRMLRHISPDQIRAVLEARKVESLWSYKTDEIILSPATVGPDGTIYVGGHDRKIHAIKDGNLLWEYETGGLVLSSCVPGPDGTVYASCWDGKIYAVRQGKKIWEFQTGNRVTSTPCLGPDGTVYVGSSDSKLYAIKDGEKVWEYKTEKGIESSPCLGPDGTVYAGSDDHNLYAVKDGKLIWKYETGGDICSSPCLGPDGTIYVGSGDMKLYAIKDGKKLWDFATNNEVDESPCVDDKGVVYIGVTKFGPPGDDRLCAIKDGRLLWEFSPGSSDLSPTTIFSPTVAPDGTVYVGCRNGKVYAVKEGVKQWEHKTGDSVQARPTSGPGNRLYVSGCDHELHALKIIYTLDDLTCDLTQGGAGDESATSSRITQEEDWIFIDGIRLDRRKTSQHLLWQAIYEAEKAGIVG